MQQGFGERGSQGDGNVGSAVLQALEYFDALEEDGLGVRVLVELIMGRAEHLVPCGTVGGSGTGGERLQCSGGEVACTDGLALAEEGQNVVTGILCVCERQVKGQDENVSAHG